MESLVLVQGVSAIVGTILSKQYRGRELPGFLLGLLLGPLGVVLIFAISDKRPKCPECASPILKGARKCAKCGSSLQEPRSPAGHTLA